MCLKLYNKVFMLERCDIWNSWLEFQSACYKQHNNLPFSEEINDMWQIKKKLLQSFDSLVIDFTLQI